MDNDPNAVPTNPNPAPDAGQGGGAWTPPAGGGAPIDAPEPMNPPAEPGNQAPPAPAGPAEAPAPDNTGDQPV